MTPIEQVLLAPGKKGLNKIRPKVRWKDYLALPAMNPSTLVKGLIATEPWQTSMKHLRYAWENPREDTDSLLWGRAVHCLLFEPRKFKRRYAVWNGGRRAGGDWDTFVAQAEALNKDILTDKQLESARLAASNVVSEPLVQEIIKSGQGEVTVMATDEGIQCRGRIDWIATGMCIADPKTTKNIAAGKFGRDFYAFRYDIKLGLYRRWLNRLTGVNWPVQVIAIENTEPHDVAVIPVPEAVLDIGEERGLKLLAELREAIVSGRWLGVAKGEVSYLHVPTFEMASVELEGAEEVAA